MTMLPIDEVLPALHLALAARSVAVLEAPPGAGKTTRVPPSLLPAPWLDGQRVLLLEPRRLAARAAAQFMARTLGESVGGTVGYRVRGESRVSPGTRIEVITEGILTRQLAHDPTLDGVGAVLFDEFHERSLAADLGLALTLQTQSLLRPALRVLVMSATLDGDAVARLLADSAGDAPIVRSTGRMFPVHTHHRPPRPQERLEAHVSRVVREAVAAHDGDLLVFLPGAREIRRVGESLASLETAVESSRVRVHELFGMLSLSAQDAAIAAAPNGERKIVLATAIAETSLTIEGVRVVVDAGRARIPRFDARVGLTRLDTVRVSQAAADQRRGRAGRVAAGTCYRLWDQHEDAMLLPRSRPEILDADLAPLALELADAGVERADALRWMDVPSEVALSAARDLLQLLGALDAERRITAHGRAMLGLPVHPRLAHMLLRAKERGIGALGSAVAACLEERDFLRGDGGPPPADLRLRVELVRGVSAGALGHDLAGARVDHDALRRTRDAARELAQRLGVLWFGATGDASGRSNRSAATHAPAMPDSVDDAGELVALAFPDRVARGRPGQRARFLLRNGTGGALRAGDPLTSHEWLAIAELEGTAPEFTIARAAPMSEQAVRDGFVADVREERLVQWDEQASRVVARRRQRLGALVLSDAPLRDLRDAEVTAVLLALVEQRGLQLLPWSGGAQGVRERLAFVHAADASWPDVSDDALIATRELWLAPPLTGVRQFSAMGDDALREGLLSLLTWTQRAALDRLAPTHVTVPSGSRIAIDYAQPLAPSLAVKLQEVFGWTETPTVLDGRVPLTLHLLSPAQRPVQVTRDLAGFWREGYFAVRKELRGRYPRHPWPDDPLTAVATRRTTRR